MSFEKVKEIIVETINCDEDKVTMDANLREDLAIDSLDATELGIAIEDNYNATIEDDVMLGFVTVGDIVKYIDENIEG